ncbi:hypothetical protein ElyMa_000227800 [Elysia marginata]|uniref:Uncharacterized protein n=1 Tax=Elysia marginata TaxID=1093978 RepID=A0AAV4F047_9GAST|nr:hypothetical protein ElyMa_000227800 [Elysia marginata]
MVNRSPGENNLLTGAQALDKDIRFCLGVVWTSCLQVLRHWTKVYQLLSRCCLDKLLTGAQALDKDIRFCLGVVYIVVIEPR